MFGYIYRTFLPWSGRFYIGQRHGNIDPTYFGSGIRIAREIKKYGKSGMIRDILFICVNQEEMDRLEIASIRNHKELAFDLINILEGGKGLTVGYKRPDWVCRKISQAQIGKKKQPHKPGQTAKIVAKLIGQKRTDEQKSRMSLACIGRKMSPSAKLNMRNARLGRKFKPLTPEHREKIAESNRITKALNRTKENKAR